MKKIIVIMAILFSVFFVTNSYAADVELVWDANAEEDLAGYKIYQGAPGAWNEIADITCAPNDATCCKHTVTGLTDGSYSWVATAYDDAGNESEYSDVTSTNIDELPPGKPSNFKATVIIVE